MGILEGRELAAILSGISGYILGKGIRTGDSPPPAYSQPPGGGAPPPSGDSPSPPASVPSPDPEPPSGAIPQNPEGDPYEGE